MKKLFLSAFLAILLMAFGSSASAWYIDYTYTGDIGFSGSADHIELEDLLEAYGSASWGVLDAVDDGSGGVDVTYYTEEWGDSTYLDGNISFQIKSDYGNMDTVLIDTQVAGAVQTHVEIYANGHDGGWGLDAVGDTEASVDHDMPVAGLSAGSWGPGDDFDSVDESIQLYANTPYNIDAFMMVDAWGYLLDVPPAHFDSWTDYDNFFDDGFYGAAIEVWAVAELDFGLTIDRTESAPVPEPATLFLLASGLIGLAGLRRRRGIK